MSSFETFVNTELPRRPTLLTSDAGSANYDGDPNDGAAPVIFQLAPKGTLYLRDTPVELYQFDGTQWFQLAAGDTLLSSSAFRMTEDLSVSIDPASGTDPSVPTVYATQAEIDARGTFATWDGAFASVPYNKGRYTLTVDLPAELSSPAVVSGASDCCFLVSGVCDAGGKVVIQGAQDIEVQASESVVSFAADVAPEVTVSGVPYSGQDHSGRFASITKSDASVQKLRIISNTDSTLFVNGFITGTPSSVRVVRNGSRLIGSAVGGGTLPINEAGATVPNLLRAGMQPSTTVGLGSLPSVVINDVDLIPGNTSITFAGAFTGSMHCAVECNHVIHDVEEQFQRFGTGLTSAFVLRAGRLRLNDCGTRNPLARPTAFPIFSKAITKSRIEPYRCGFQASSNAAEFADTEIFMVSTVFERQSGAFGAAMKLEAGANLYPARFANNPTFGGVLNTLEGPIIGLEMVRATMNDEEQAEGAQLFGLRIQNITGPAIRMQDGSILNLRESSANSISTLNVTGHLVEFAGDHNQLVLVGYDAGSGTTDPDILFDDGLEIDLFQASETHPRGAIRESVRGNYVEVIE